MHILLKRMPSGFFDNAKLFSCLCNQSLASRFGAVKRINLETLFLIMLFHFCIVFYQSCVHLVNQYHPPKGYLDTYGHAYGGRPGFRVETTNTKDRDQGSGTWKIITATGFPGCGNQ